jgi:TonB-dependent starch-binding outer membrane protein SusC
MRAILKLGYAPMRLLALVVIFTLGVLATYAQSAPEDITYSGVVQNAKGQPVVGALVATRDGKFSTLTDNEGKYSLTVPKVSRRVLVITGNGFKRREVAVTSPSAINVQLDESPVGNDDVVVVGYGSRKKADLSGAVTEVGSELITNQPIVSVDQGLAGLLPGVTLREGTGAPGAGPEILIRGINGFGNNKPLVVIDDVIFENGNDQNNNPLALINPEDIASVVVLKDAATKAIYGSRATAGVILITTKKGKAGKAKISFSSNIGVSNAMPFEKPDLLNASELAQFRKEVVIDRIRAHGQYVGGSAYAMFADPNIPITDAVILGAPSAVTGSAIPLTNFINPQQYTTSTDWYNEVLRQATTQNYNLNMSGGSEGFKYFVSGNYLNQEGVIIFNDIKRYSLRANIEAKLNKRIRFGMNINPTITKASRSSDDPSSGQFSAYSSVTSTYWVDPSAPVYSPNGFFNYTTRSTLNSNWTANPVYQLQAEEEKRRNTQVLMNTFLEIEPIKNLFWKSSFNYGYTQGRSTNYQPGTLVGDGSLTPVFPNLDSARAVLFNNLTNNIILDNTLRYAFDVKKHSFSVMGGVSIQDQTSENSSLSAKKILDPNFIFPNSGNVSLAAIGNFTGSAGYARFRFYSLLSRLNYGYDDKYLLNFSIRRDGTSRFGRDVQYGVFPAGSATWRVTEEKFMKNLKKKWLNDLRLEVGYGLTGNANGVGAYEHLGGVTTANYVFGNSLNIGNTVSGLPNPTLTWEESKQLDLGLNASLLNKRVNVAFNYYVQRTEGLLAGIPLSWITGFGNVIGNQNSKVENKGFEVSVDIVAVKKKNFIWTTGINASQYKNKILEYFVPGGFTNGTAGNGTNVAISQPGQPIGMYRGLKILGLYTAADIADPNVPKYAGARVGGTKYFDGNGNGVLDGNLEADYVTLGNPHPELSFGWNNQIRFKEFSVRMVFAGQIGGLIYDLRREIMWNVDGNFNVERQVTNRWRPGDDPATKQFGSTSFNTNLYRIPSDNKIYDGSYFAMKNLTFGYNIGKILNFKKKLVDNSEFNISLRNVFYIANYKYGNPETRRSNDGSALRGINYGSNPISRSLTVGLNVAF